MRQGKECVNCGKWFWRADGIKLSAWHKRTACKASCRSRGPRAGPISRLDESEYPPALAHAFTTGKLMPLE